MQALRQKKNKEWEKGPVAKQEAPFRKLTCDIQNLVILTNSNVRQINAPIPVVRDGRL